MPELVAIVGAGVAGLGCARALVESGVAVSIFERARGVGGRCATRRLGGMPGESPLPPELQGQAVDHGPAFLHGSDAAFLRALREVEGQLPGWPERLVGAGRPCQPAAFEAGETRLAYSVGVSAFPKRLAEGLAVRLQTAVERLAESPAGLSLWGAEGPLAEAPAVVLALAGEQALRLLETLPAGVLRREELEAACQLLRQEPSSPCLTAIVVCRPGLEGPAWDVCYPDASPKATDSLQLISHDSAKRPSPKGTVLVLQANSRWSRETLRAETPPEVWAQALLAAARPWVGELCDQPLALLPHRWRFGRSERAGGLTSPLLLRCENGALLGLCGERFAAGGGVEAAFLSGQRLARRLTADSSAEVNRT